MDTIERMRHIGSIGAICAQHSCGDCDVFDYIGSNSNVITCVVYAMQQCCCDKMYTFSLSSRGYVTSPLLNGDMIYMTRAGWATDKDALCDIQIDERAMRFIERWVPRSDCSPLPLLNMCVVHYIVERIHLRDKEWPDIDSIQPVLMRFGKQRFMDIEPLLNRLCYQQGHGWCKCIIDV